MSKVTKRARSPAYLSRSGGGNAIMAIPEPGGLAIVFRRPILRSDVVDGKLVPSAVTYCSKSKRVTEIRITEQAAESIYQILAEWRKEKEQEQIEIKDSTQY